MALYTYGSNGAAVVIDAAGNARGDFPVDVIDPATGAKVTQLFEKDGTTAITQLKTNKLGGPQPGALREFKTNVPGVVYKFKDGANDVTWWELSREAAKEARAAADGAKTVADAAIPKTQLGTANGVAGLDANKWVPQEQLMPRVVRWSAYRKAGPPPTPYKFKAGSAWQFFSPQADNWVSIRLTVPPSGFVRITISGSLISHQKDASAPNHYYSVALRALVSSDSAGSDVLATSSQLQGTGKFAAERSGIYRLTPAATVYIFPQYYSTLADQGKNKEMQLLAGDLIVEAMPPLNFSQTPQYVDWESDPTPGIEHWYAINEGM